jgi:hypothetical protein
MRSATRVRYRGWMRSTACKVRDADEGRYGKAMDTPQKAGALSRIGGNSSLAHIPSYFIAIPWGRAGPVGKAMLKSSLKRVSSVSVS